MSPDREREVRDRAHGRVVRAFLATTAVLSLFVGALGGYGYAAFSQAQDATKKIPQVRQDPNGRDVPHNDYGPCIDRVCNYLILGSDSREGLSHEEQVAAGTDEEIGGTNRSDVIMLVHTDPDQERATILSFPRDLWVPIWHRDENKINSAFEGGLRGGGPQLVVKTVEDLTGVHINHWLYVDLARFEHIVEVLNGVNMCVPASQVNTPGWLTQSSATGETQVYYEAPGHIVDPNTGLDIKPGCQLLDAQQALAYVRTRHLPCDNVPDFSRIGRQQQFLRAVLNRLLTPSEIAQAPTLVKPIAQNLATDEEFKLADVIYLLGQLKGISTGDVDFRAVPGVPETNSSGLSIVTMDPKARELFSALAENKQLPSNVGVQLEGTPVSEAQISVPVVDHASGGLAAGVETVLSDSGFNVAPGIEQFAAFGADVNGSVIAYEPGRIVEAQVVGQYFPNLKLVEVARHSLHGNPVAVFITASFEPPEDGSGPPPAESCVNPTV
ncbi:MAG TPA: LCP family protein [Actinomycetota bacterium]|jgi:LCP family protein required for cell wall assembly|nr:LCP family protein [Actinomycetota bacterium]